MNQNMTDINKKKRSRKQNKIKFAPLRVNYSSSVNCFLARALVYLFLQLYVGIPDMKSYYCYEKNNATRTL